MLNLKYNYNIFRNKKHYWQPCLFYYNIVKMFSKFYMLKNIVKICLYFMNSKHCSIHLVLKHQVLAL